MSTYKSLKPHAYTLELMGGTGDGKTEIATVYATKEARRILLNCVGRTNSTLKERLLVYSEEYTDKMVVATKFGDDVFERGLFIDMISQAWAKVIKSQGKVSSSINGKDEEELKQYLFGEINGKNNARAILSFLTEEQKRQFVENTIVVYHNYELHKYNFEVYNTVKNNLADTEVKENSAKFLAGIKSEAERVLDNQSEEFSIRIWEVWKNVNRQLREVFFTYFEEECRSDDGYYYKEISLENPDDKFIAAMFTANDVQKGQKLSLEVLCSEIIIYIPLSNVVAKMIKENPKAQNVFRDSQDNIVFAVLDTRGLYHSDNSEADNTDYLSDLLYHGEADALLMVVPLFGDLNEKKISELYKEAFKNFNKQIPVFMIHNKLDLFVDSLNKESFDDDPLSMEMDGGKELSANDIIQKIYDRELELREELQKVQGKARKNLEIKSLSCYLKRDNTMQPELVKRFNIINALSSIFNDTADYLKEAAVKIPLVVTNSDYDEVSIVIDEETLVKLVQDQISKESTDKKVFTPGLQDLSLSIGITPHGNSYNALRRRLKNGDGYTSNIMESYFYECRSFSINFTANMRNFVSKELIDEVVSQTIKIQGGELAQEDQNKFLEIVKKNVNPYNLVSLLLYHNAMLEAEKTAFSFRTKFQNFLQNSKAYFDRAQIKSEDYFNAVNKIVKDAAEHSLYMHVTYR